MIFTTLDRYLARRMLRPFGSVLAIIVMLLSLENTARLMSQLDDVEKPLAVLMRFTGYLVPEYLGIALMFALFIGVALTFRSLALSGEFDIIAAMGLSPIRMLRVPLAIAFISAALFLLTRAYLEPWGERQLDSFGASVRAGELGLAIDAGEFYSSSTKFTFHAEKIGQRQGNFVNVMVRTDKDVLFARSAHAVNGGSSGILLILADGQIIRGVGSSGYHVVDFTQARLTLGGNPAAKATTTSRQLNDRLSLNQLLTLGFRTREAANSPAARASFVARITSALIIPALPFLALALAIPPKRQSGAIGIGLGILFVILFIQLSNAIEDAASSIAIIEFVALWAAITLVAFAAWRAHIVCGSGQIELQLQHCVALALRSCKTLLRMKSPGVEKNDR